MHIFNVIYYNYYLFYTKIPAGPSPDIIASYSFGLIQAFILNGLIDAISVTRFCYSVDIWPRVILGLLIMEANYGIYVRTGRAKKIVAKDPRILNSHILSKLTALLFFLFAMYCLIWSGIYAKEILDKCRPPYK